MPEFVKKEKIQIAILTVPKEEAAGIAKQLVDLGVEGFWNFALVDLKLSEGVVVENVHLEESLMNLAYNISRLDIVNSKLGVDYEEN